MVAALSLEERAAQVLLVGVDGRLRFSEASLAMVRSLGPGGVMLFGFNIPEKAGDLAAPLAGLQDAAAASGAGLPLIVALDHEGGGVFRFHGGITRPPSPLETGSRGPGFARLLGERVGRELRALGVNFVLGPVVEGLTVANQAFLGSRSFGRDPVHVDEVAGAYIEGLTLGGVASSAKHFPGNGSIDPHAGLPSLEMSREAFAREYLPRFASAIRAGVPSIMLSHVLVPAYDARNPATLSPALVGGLLRGRLGFEGVILTDDLLMKALSMPPRRSAVEALAAGADLLMLSSGDAALPVRDALVAAVKKGVLPESRLTEAAVRVVALKLRFGLEASLDPAARSKALAAFPGLVAESATLLDASLHRPR